MKSFTFQIETSYVARKPRDANWYIATGQALPPTDLQQIRAQYRARSKLAMSCIASFYDTMSRALAA